MLKSEQIKELDAPLSRERVKTRKQGNATVSYVEFWDVVAQANMIFGYDGWSRETMELRLVSEAGRTIGEAKAPGWGVSYVCKVRVRVGEVTREGTGTGHGIDRDLGQAHESAAKEAESDATKRAFMTFGNQFGLALYDKSQANVADETDIVYRRYMLDTMDTIEAFGADHAARVAWWNSQKGVRLDMNVSDADLRTLQNLVKSKAPKKETTDEQDR
jgi:DNA repair and recombination protein RAD52